MKRTFLISIFIFLNFISPVSAQEDSGLINPLGYNSIWGVLGAFLPVIAIIIGIALVGYLLYGAFLWMSSGDNPEQLKGAQKTIVNAVIGFALFGVMLGLFFFLSYVLGIEWSSLFSGVTTT